jgi:hypothetical protein
LLFFVEDNPLDRFPTLQKTIGIVKLDKPQQFPDSSDAFPLSSDPLSHNIDLI